MDKWLELGISRVQAVVMLGITRLGRGVSRRRWGIVDGLSTGPAHQISALLLGSRDLSALSTPPTIYTIVNNSFHH